MIVKMSKYAFMVFHKEYDTFLSTLRDLGVVHIKETNSVMDNERLQELLAERKRRLRPFSFYCTLQLCKLPHLIPPY